MPDAAVFEGLYAKWSSMFDHLDERARRLWAASEAIAIGRGGIAAVAKATGLSDRTVRNGIAEIRGDDWRWQSKRGPPWQPETGPGGLGGGDLGVPVR